MGGKGIRTSAKEDRGFANILTGDTKLSKKWRPTMKRHGNNRFLE
jgi:hypothetical protein